MFRLVIGIFIFAFIVYLLKTIARLSFNVRKAVREVRTLRDDLNAGGRQSKAKQVSAEMVRCAACGAFVSARDAMMVSSRGRSAAFCSEECLRAHVKSA
ncbi:MAG TPA: hypothetical protein VFD58_10075 [Blastocatellia bacterium]|nr:hypothetical protein [Blastocatellia bacterium]